MRKRILSAILSLVMVASLLPAALAEEPETTPEPPAADTSAEVNAPAEEPEEEPEEELEAPVLLTVEEPEHEAHTFTTAGPSGIAWISEIESRAGTATFAQQLTGDAKTIYNKLCEAESLGKIRNGEKIAVTLKERTFGAQELGQIEMFIQADTDAMFAAARNAAAAFNRDHPEVFWTGGIESANFTRKNGEDLSGSFSLEAATYSVGIYVTLNKSGSWATGGRNVTADEATVTSQVKAVAAQATGTTRYDKLLAVHDWLTKNNTYNSNAALNVGNPADSTPWTPLSALDSSLSPVCEGYARAFKLICDELNIPCVLVSGEGRTSRGTEPHMWNYVQMEDQKWYAVDATWDDPVTVGGSGQETHDYFLVGGSDTIGGSVFTNSHIAQGNNFLTGGHQPFTYPELNSTGYVKSADLTGLTVTANSETVAVPTASQQQATVQLTAMAQYSDKNSKDVTSQTTWTVNAPTGVSVNNSGLVTILPTAGTYDGRVNVTVKGAYDGKEGSVQLTLTKENATAASVSAISGEGSLTIPVSGSAATARYSATATDQYGQTMTGGITWSLEGNTDNEKVSINSSGLLTVQPGAKANNSLTVKATAGGKSATKTVSLTRESARAATVEINAGAETIAVPTVSGHGGSATPNTLALTATVKDQYGETMNGQQITWALTGGTVQGVTFSGSTLQVTNKAVAGSVTVKATVNGTNVSADKTITVTKAGPVATYVTISGLDRINKPTEGSASADYTAAVYDQYDALMNGQTITWSLEGEPAGVDVTNGKVTVQSTSEAESVVLKAAVGGAEATKTISIISKTAATVTINDGSVPADARVDKPFGQNIQLSASAGSQTGGTWSWSVTGADGLLQVVSGANSDTVTLKPLKTGASATVTAVYESETAYGTAQVQVTVVKGAAPDDQTAAAAVAFNNTATQTVDVGRYAPADGGAVALRVGTVTGEDILAATTAAAGTNVSFALKNTLTAEDVGKSASIPVTVTTDHYQGFTVTITVTVARDAQKGTLTFRANGGSGTQTDITANEGERVALPGCTFTAPAGQRFKTWAFNASNGNPYAPGHQWTVTPGTAVFYAVWENIPSTGGSGGSGGSSGGSSGGASSGSGTVSRPTTGGGSTTVGVEVRPTVSGSAASATISSSAMNDAVNSAIQEANRQETAPVVEIDVPTTSRATSMEITIPSGALDTLGDRRNAQLTVTSGVATVTLDRSAITAVADQAGSQITLAVAPVSRSRLNSSQQAAVGDGIVVDLSLRSGSRAISDFRGGEATVTLPYELPQGQDPSLVTVYFLNDQGELIPCTTSYDARRGQVTFTTGHFSKYLIRSAARPWSNPFLDVPANAWYMEELQYVSEQGLMSGNTVSTFNPGGVASRQQIWMILARLSGQTPANMAAARQWAMDNGISDGTNPGAPVTRQQLAALLYRYEQMNGGGFTGTWAFPLNYPDADRVAQYAYEPLCWMTMNGVITGTAAGTLDPSGTATRAQLAVILARFAQLT